MSTEPLVTDRHLSQMINVLLSDMDLRIGFCRKNYSELFRDCAQGNSTGFLYMDELLGWSRPLLEHVALSNSPRYTFKKPVIKTEDGKKNRERQSLPAVNLPKVGAQDDVCQGQTGFVSYGLFYVDCSKDEEAQRTIQLPEWFLYLFVDWASPADMAPHLLFRYQLLLSAVDEPNLKNLASDTKILIDEGHEIVPFKDDGLIESIIACIETQSMCERDLLRRALTNQPGLPVYEWLKQIGFSEDLTQLKSAYPNQPYSSSSNMTIRPSAKVTGALSITGRNGYLYASFFEYEGEFYLVTNKAARHAFLNDEMLLPLVFDQLKNTSCLSSWRGEVAQRVVLSS